MTATTDKRRCDRISIRLEVYFSEDLHEVVGTLTDISYSGALIEDTSMQPAMPRPLDGPATQIAHDHILFDDPA